MRKVLAFFGVAFLWFIPASQAQLAVPNRAGVAMGHLHYYVRDVEADKKFWMTLGGKPTKFGTTDVIKFPDVLILLTQRESSGGTEGSALNHVAFKVPNINAVLATLKAAGYEMEEPRPGVTPANAQVYTPDHDRVEIFQEQTELARFDVDEGRDDAASHRMNDKLTVPIRTHHVHMYSPAGSEAAAKEWYVKVFGAIPGHRGVHYEAADLPGINLNFCSSGCSHNAGVSIPAESAAVLAPTKGRRLDHIGFEVRNLEAFCRRLEAAGVKFDVPYTKQTDGFASAFITDPWGVYVELTEGLNRL
jgi:catechol 2,3-dioxygenase-like lactoylglutathione lyase family enzyme